MKKLLRPVNMNTAIISVVVAILVITAVCTALCAVALSSDAGGLWREVGQLAQEPDNAVSGWGILAGVFAGLSAAIMIAALWGMAAGLTIVAMLLLVPLLVACRMYKHGKLTAYRVLAGIDWAVMFFIAVLAATAGGKTLILSAILCAGIIVGIWNTYTDRIKK